MANQEPDLWANLATLKVRSPKAILLQQAAILTNKTGGLLTGDVDAQTDDSFETYRLDVVARENRNLRRRILAARYKKASPYPCLISAVVVFTSDKSPDLNPQWRAGLGIEPKDWQFAATEEKFIEYLRLVLAHQGTLGALQSMLAVINEEELLEKKAEHASANAGDGIASSKVELPPKE